MEVRYVNACLLRCYVAVQFWTGTQYPDGLADQPNNDQLYAGCEYNGQQTDGKHSSIWNVHQSRQSNRSLGNVSSYGCFNTHALHTCNCCPLGCRSTNSVVGEHAGAEQYIDVDVQLGWGDIGCESGSGY